MIYSVNVGMGMGPSGGGLGIGGCFKSDFRTMVGFFGSKVLSVWLSCRGPILPMGRATCYGRRDTIFPSVRFWHLFWLGLFFFFFWDLTLKIPPLSLLRYTLPLLGHILHGVWEKHLTTSRQKQHRNRRMDQLPRAVSYKLAPVPSNYMPTCIPTGFK